MTNDPNGEEIRAVLLVYSQFKRLSLKTQNIVRATSCRKCDIFTYTITVVVFPEGHSTFALIEIPFFVTFFVLQPLWFALTALLSHLPSSDF